ncbi:hypothetical protein [Micromonospora mirobrigensis]|uniref:hypothetical protein n=1 Tax=Micromonospora mirobrigensis TaxID=262898 RepID=UPI000B81A719|nr:hypothetical protein [Micromonospora mirobrigensis]
MSRQRIGAIVLLPVAFLALSARRTFGFLDHIPGLVEAAIVVVGVACALLGVRLWLQMPPGDKR